MKTKWLFTLYVFSSTVSLVNAQQIKRDKDSAYILAGKYLNKKAATQDDKQKALNLYVQSAKTDNTKSMVVLGKMYKHGTATSKDFDASAKWFEKAANAGDTKGWYNLGLAYKYGMGKKQDFEKAYDCFKKAADMNDPDGWYGQGYMLYCGFGCTQNYEKAFELFIKGAKAYKPESMYFMGLCMRNGYGTRQDEKAAKYWIRQAQIRGYKQATHELSQNEPENTNEGGSIAKNLLEAEKLNYIKGSSLRNLVRNEHDSKIKDDNIIGNYTGFLLKYDWSGKHVIACTKVTLTLAKKQNKITGLWKEEGNIEMPITASLTNGGLVFDKTEYRKTDHYNPIKLIAPVLQFEKAKLNYTKRGDSLFLGGNLQLYAIERKEPEKPQQIVLFKLANDKQAAKTVASVAANTIEETPQTRTSLVTYPNPFSSTLKLSFSLKQNTTVKAVIYTLDGKMVYNGTSYAMLKGLQNISVQPPIPAGTYILKLYCGNEVLSTKVVKQ